jgi:hypothetical protein
VRSTVAIQVPPSLCEVKQLHGVLVLPANRTLRTMSPLLLLPGDTS